MSISHELSSEIAAALLTKKDRSQDELNELKKLVFEIHSTLQRLAENTRDESSPPTEAKSATQGS